MTKLTNDFEIVTDISKITTNNDELDGKKITRKPKLVRKHTLAYDTIHNIKLETNSLEYEENYIIPDMNVGFEVRNDLDTSHNYNSTEYFRSNELKQQVYELLSTKTKLDFSADVKRRIPSVTDLDEYFTMLMTELVHSNYSHLEVFIVLSEFFTDNIYNVYKKLNTTYKKAIYNNLTNKHPINDIDEMDFI